MDRLCKECCKNVTFVIEIGKDKWYESIIKEAVEPYGYESGKRYTEVKECPKTILMKSGVFVKKAFVVSTLYRIVLLALFVVTAVIALITRVKLIEARELLAENFVMSRLTRMLVVNNCESDACNILIIMQRQIMQYATCRNVAHSSLRFAALVAVDELDMYNLAESEAEMFASYVNVLVEGGNDNFTRLENLLYKKWPSSREHWCDWGNNIEHTESKRASVMAHEDLVDGKTPKKTTPVIVQGDSAGDGEDVEKISR